MIYQRHYYQYNQLFIFIIFLLQLTACNKSKTSTKEAGNEQVAKTDSVFIENYLKQEPKLKKYRATTMLFYRTRNYRLGWFKKDKLVPQANTFLQVVSKASLEGLNPADYKVKDFNALFKQYQGTQDDSLKQRLQQKIDVALSAAYFNYASDFYRGTVNPRELDNIEWSVKRNKIKLHKALQTILRERNSRYPYYQFEPLHEEYDRLRTALAQYREIRKNGGWPKIVNVTNSLKVGQTSAAVPLLRQRLLPPNQAIVNRPDSLVYDAELVKAVKDFQERHGLKPDGSLGKETLRLMNVSLDDRIDQIIINMERWRWIPKPKEMERKHIFVNIPAYELYAKDKGKTVFNMRVIVGKVMNSTPIFSDKLEYIVFSPYWYVPYSIIENEMMPHLLADPGWLERMDMEVVQGSGKATTPVDPYSIDWSAITKETFKYAIRQRPGPKNPLGDIKFIFPNEHEVYLHHTAAEQLFNQTQRGFSHGCIRVEKPVQLAEFLLADKPQWTEQTILEAMHAGEEQYENLKEKVPVYIVYFTSWVDDQGGIHFRDDIYGHDKELEKEYFN
ncbi:L,D-transpeptidase family protein [Adhaeribacter pallidiroseus]|uniref:Putative L,D-transpeptidase YcbB n=1 Tax=Adhaeribacter pallidiroseus TaxID=2072847 RepID=A0A369QFA8_9BACT|nr:L,D-transpeptidase family protein [Adhaeribacter pallidiroseus]RDC63112.1 putative L,D-transpeptidase YcbB [Adhaeribacter pallidiroseus]